MSGKVLIIDDDPGILEALTIGLEMAGYTVASCPSQASVTQTLDSFAPDCILLDYFLSGTTGDQLLGLIRSHPSVAAVPVILTSAHPGGEKLFAGTKADGFISKPFDLDRLVDLLNTTISSSSAGHKRA